MYLIYWWRSACWWWSTSSGEIGKGAQRWIDLGFIQLQPSGNHESGSGHHPARYFHGLTYEEMGRPLSLIIPLPLMALPPAGSGAETARSRHGRHVVAAAGAMSAAGVRWWKFAVVLAVVVAGAHYAWNSDILCTTIRRRGRDIPQPRIRTARETRVSHHQSKIAFGSGGPLRGFLQGTQSHLDFSARAPDRFHFLTMYAEEFGTWWRYPADAFTCCSTAW